MNLIEKLGGYDRASKIANCKSGVVHPTKPLLDALLEYRRANNIFEVGDKVVLIGSCSDWSDRVEEIQEFRREMVITLDFNYVLRSDVIQHAKDEEIKAGHRISHHTDNLSHFDHCTDIANHISPLTKVTER